MAIGLLLGKEEVKGSCNGLSNLVESDHSCELCSVNQNDNNLSTTEY